MIVVPRRGIKKTDGGGAPNECPVHQCDFLQRVCHNEPAHSLQVQPVYGAQAHETSFLRGKTSAGGLELANHLAKSPSRSIQQCRSPGDEPLCKPFPEEKLFVAEVGFFVRTRARLQGA